MSKYSEKKERQRIEMMNEANRERQRVELIKEAVAKEREKKAEETIGVAAKVDVINHLVEILSLFKEAESALHKAYSAITETRFKHVDMVNFFKGVEINSLFAIEKTNSSIVKTKTLIIFLGSQPGMPSFEVDSLNFNEQPTMEEES